MKKVEITSISSRGQIVIPQSIRNELKLETGEKLLVFGSKDTIILKKLQVPSLKDFEKIIDKEANQDKK